MRRIFYTVAAIIVAICICVYGQPAESAFAVTRVNATGVVFTISGDMENLRIDTDAAERIRTEFLSTRQATGDPVTLATGERWTPRLSEFRPSFNDHAYLCGNMPDAHVFCLDETDGLLYEVGDYNNAGAWHPALIADVLFFAMTNAQILVFLVVFILAILAQLVILFFAWVVWTFFKGMLDKSTQFDFGFYVGSPTYASNTQWMFDNDQNFRSGMNNGAWILFPEVGVASAQWLPPLTPLAQTAGILQHTQTMP